VHISGLLRTPRLAVWSVSLLLVGGVCLLFLWHVHRFRVADKALRQHGAFIMGDLYTVSIPASVEEPELTSLLKAMRDCRCPRRLLLAGCRVSEEGFAVIGTMTWLYQLSLRSTNVTDADVDKFSRLQSLEMLSLGHTDVSDASLRCISGLRELREVHLRESRVSQQGVDALQRIRPDLRIPMKRSKKREPPRVTALAK
jgi:hypothetical protein